MFDVGPPPTIDDKYSKLSAAAKVRKSVNVFKEEDKAEFERRNSIIYK
jgi:hypothetical protein